MKFTHRLRHQHLLNFGDSLYSLVAELIPLWPTWLLQSNHLQMNSLRSPSVTCVENPLLQQLNSCHVVVVSIIFYFHPYLGKWSNLTNMFQMGLKPPTRFHVVFVKFRFLRPLFQNHPRDLTGAWATAACGRSATDSVLQCHVAQEGPMIRLVFGLVRHRRHLKIAQLELL